MEPKLVLPPDTSPPPRREHTPSSKGAPPPRRELSSSSGYSSFRSALRCVLLCAQLLCQPACSAAAFAASAQADASAVLLMHSLSHLVLTACVHVGCLLLQEHGAAAQQREKQDWPFPGFSLFTAFHVLRRVHAACCACETGAPVY